MGAGEEIGRDSAHTVWCSNGAQGNCYHGLLWGLLTEQTRAAQRLDEIRADSLNLALTSATSQWARKQ